MRVRHVRVMCVCVCALVCVHARLVYSRQSWCGCSSVPSPQSLTSLQTFLWPMQRPFPHRNWSGAQGGLSVITHTHTAISTLYSDLDWEWVDLTNQ